MYKIIIAYLIVMASTVVATTTGADAACTITNTLSNGTPADATKVRDNFTDLAACTAPVANPTFTGAAGAANGQLNFYDASVYFGRSSTRASIYGAAGVDLNTGNVTGYNIKFSINGTEAARISSAGFLLVGLTSNSGLSDAHVISAKLTPEASNVVLAIAGGSGGTYPTGSFWSVSGTGWNSAGTALTLGKDSGTNRSLNAGGSLNASGADYAEYFYQESSGSLHTGQLVSLNRESGKVEAAGKGAIPIGIVSANPGFVGNDLFDKAHPESTALVGLTGQLLTQVNLEGGAIAVGDRLAASTTPGVVKKASSQEPAIGLAMERWSGPAAGKIVVFIRPDMGVPSLETVSANQQTAGATLNGILGAIRDLRTTNADQALTIRELRARLDGLEQARESKIVASAGNAVRQPVLRDNAQKQSVPN